MLACDVTINRHDTMLACDVTINRHTMLACDITINRHDICQPVMLLLIDTIPCSNHYHHHDRLVSKRALKAVHDSITTLPSQLAI